MLKLTITIADSVPPVPLDVPESKVELCYDRDGTVWGYRYTVNRQNWMLFPDLASFCFGSGTDEVAAIAQPLTPTELIWELYYRIVLPIALQATGQEVLHASAVQTPKGVIALCAVSETGKSTIAYGLSQRGYPLWADDAVLWEIFDKSVQVIPLPFKIRLRPASAAYFGHDKNGAYSPISRDSADLVKGEPAALAALCVLKRVFDLDDGVAVESFRLSPNQAFPALLTHAYCFSLQDMKRKGCMMQHYLDLAMRVPVFEIRFQSGLENLSAIMDEIERCCSIQKTI